MSARARLKAMALEFRAKAVEAQNCALVFERGAAQWELLSELASEEACAGLIASYEEGLASNGETAAIDALVNVRGQGQS